MYVNTLLLKERKFDWKENFLLLLMPIWGNLNLCNIYILQYTYVTHHIKTGHLSVECISRYYFFYVGKNKENKKKIGSIFDHKIAMLYQIYTWKVSSLSW